MVEALRAERKRELRRRYNVRFKSTIPYARRLEEYNAMRRARRRELKLKREAIQQQALDARRARDTLAANALAKDSQYRFHQQERKVTNKIAEKVRNKAKALKRFECEVCDQVFATDFALNKHVTTSQEHKDRVDGVQKPERPADLQRYAANLKAAREATKASGKFACALCPGKTFENDWSLKRHYKSKGHQDKEKKAKGLF
jgi:hypothetical protein